MKGWMDDRRMNEWIDGSTKGLMDAWIERWMAD